MPTIAHISRSGKTASKKDFVVSGVISMIKIGNSIAHNLLGIKSTCRYEVTCSTFAIRSIEEKGILKGSMVSLRRVINCQPFFKV